MGFHTQTDPAIVDAVTAVFEQGRKLETQQQRKAFVFSVSACAIEQIKENLGEEVAKRFLLDCQKTLLQAEAEVTTTH